MGISGTIINPVVKCFISPKGVGVVKLQEISAFTWKFVAPPLHGQVAVLAVHGEDFRQVGVGVSFGALLDVPVADGPCRNHMIHKVNTPNRNPSGGKTYKSTTAIAKRGVGA